MKSTMLLVVCLIFALAVSANAAVPLVEVTFESGGINDAPNLGSLGGTQYLNGYNGWGQKTDQNPQFWEATVSRPPTNTSSGVNYWNMFTAGSGSVYGDYGTPALPVLTLAAWIRPNHFLSWRNVLMFENATGAEGTAAARELGIWYESSNLHITAGPSGNIDVAGAFTAQVWTHVAVTYDSAGATKVYIDGVDTAFTG